MPHQGINKRGERTLHILQSIAEGAGGIFAVWEAIIIAGYGASQGRIKSVMREQNARRAQEIRRDVDEQRLRQKYYNLVSKLKREGCITERARGEKQVLALTAKGNCKREQLAAQLASQLPPPRYARERGTHLLIIAFDIPEREKRKRDWLRNILKFLGLQMIQKSVWIGKVKIPPEFLDDLRNLNLIEHVEIFEVGNTGSLRHVM